MKFLDLFAGIGGFRLGMEAAGHTCIGFCEIDKFARRSYKAIFDTERETELHDIRTASDDTIRRLGHVDVICGGFPCQSFSLAGKRLGFDDERGDLFFEVVRFARLLRPKYLFLENVPGLLNHDSGCTFETIIGTLDELGYDAEWQVLNSKNFSVPQDRQRLFIIGHSRRYPLRPIFPIETGYPKATEESAQAVNTLTARYGNGGSRSYIIENQSQKVIKLGNINPSGKGQNGDVYLANGLAPTLTTNKGEGIKIIQRGRGFNKGGEYDMAPTLTSHHWRENNFLKIYDGHNRRYVQGIGSLTASGFSGSTTAGTFLLDTGNYLRKLTPRECWRLQGFPDWVFDRARLVNSDSQLYKQAGNSVTVNVIEAIAKRL